MPLLLDSKQDAALVTMPKSQVAISVTWVALDLLKLTLKGYI